MHGFIFALGDQGVARRNANAWRLLDIPQPDKSAGALVMLGNHSHVLLNGSIYSTSDMGLSWERIGGLDNVQSIGVDQNEDLLATTDTGLYRWRDKTWSLLVQLPENKPVEKLQVFQDRLYALADGKLFRLIKGGWESVAFPAAIADLAMHYPDTLWVAEVGDQMLWSTEDGVNWQSTPIED
jgi:hypothetical protein